MLNQNLFVAEGSVGQTPEFKTVPIRTKNGDEHKDLLEMSVRFDLRIYNPEKEQYEDVKGFWARVKEWGPRARLNHGLLTKGCRILVVGNQSQGEHIAKKGAREGQSITTTTIEAMSIGLIPYGVESIIWESKDAKNQAVINNSIHESASAS